MLVRLGLLAAIGLVGLMAVLPGARAHDPVDANLADIGDPELLYPAPLSSEHFSGFHSGTPLKGLEAVGALLNGS